MTSPVSARRRASLSSPVESRFDRRLSKILVHATEVFYEKGYEGASMRDLARASGMSLSGLYYYFESKEKLLYLIQKHTFTTIVERLRERLDHVSDPEQRIRVFILNHLEYFLPIHVYLAMRADLLERGGSISSIITGGRFVPAGRRFVDE